MNKKSKSKNEDFMPEVDGEQISMITEIATDIDENEASHLDFQTEFPIMALRNMVMFPHVVMPVTIGRSSSLKLVNMAFRKKQPIVLACQVAAEVDDPGYQDLYHVGVIAKVLRIFEMPGGNTTAIMQSNGPRVHLDSIVRTQPYMKGIVTPLPEEDADEQSEEFKALMDSCKELIP